jgi:hypothetical protein
LPVGLRKIFLSMIHGFARPLPVSFTLTTCQSIFVRTNDLLSARSLTLEPSEPSPPFLRGVPSSALEGRPDMRSSRCPFGRLLGRNWFKCADIILVCEAGLP